MFPLLRSCIIAADVCCSCLRLPGGWSSDVVSLVKGADFSAARVALVASVPGYHTGELHLQA